MPNALPSERLGLAYGDDPHQRLDLYPCPDAPLVAFVHGGAWKGGSRHEYDGIARRLRREGIAAATVDYRLSPAVRHPAHAEDVANALGGLRARGHARIFVVGHSAGAHVAATIATTPTLLAQAQPAGFVGLEGIYDVPALARRWPTYPRWFLNDAFGPDPASWPTPGAVVSHAPWLLVHSEGDELVDRGQTDGFAAHLENAGVRVEVLRPQGESHDGVVRNLARPDDAVATAIVAFVRGT